MLSNFTRPNFLSVISSLGAGFFFSLLIYTFVPQEYVRFAYGGVAITGSVAGEVAFRQFLRNSVSRKGIIPPILNLLLIAAVIVVGVVIVPEFFKDGTRELIFMIIFAIAFLLGATRSFIGLNPPQATKSLVD